MVTIPNPMTLSPEVAAVLRAALNKSLRVATMRPALAYQVIDQARAYKLLVFAIENLLEPLPEDPDQGQPSDLFAPYLASGDEKDLPW